MELTALVSIIGILLSAITFFIGRVTAAKTDGIADGELRSDIKHIKSAVDKQDRKLYDTEVSYNRLKSEIAELKERLHVLEERVQLFHGE